MAISSLVMSHKKAIRRPFRQCEPNARPSFRFAVTCCSPPCAPVRSWTTSMFLEGFRRSLHFKRAYSRDARTRAERTATADDTRRGGRPSKSTSTHQSSLSPRNETTTNAGFSSLRRAFFVSWHHLEKAAPAARPTLFPTVISQRLRRVEADERHHHKYHH